MTGYKINITYRFTFSDRFYRCIILSIFAFFVVGWTHVYGNDLSGIIVKNEGIEGGRNFTLRGGSNLYTLVPSNNRQGADNTSPFEEPLSGMQDLREAKNLPSIMQLSVSQVLVINHLMANETQQDRNPTCTAGFTAEIYDILERGLLNDITQEHLNGLFLSPQFISAIFNPVVPGDEEVPNSSSFRLMFYRYSGSYYLLSERDGQVYSVSFDSEVPRSLTYSSSTTSRGDIQSGGQRLASVRIAHLSSMGVINAVQRRDANYELDSSQLINSQAIWNIIYHAFHNYFPDSWAGLIHRLTGSHSRAIEVFFRSIVLPEVFRPRGGRQMMNSRELAEALRVIAQSSLDNALTPEEYEAFFNSLEGVHSSLSLSSSHEAHMIECNKFAELCGKAPYVGIERRNPLGMLSLLGCLAGDNRYLVRQLMGAIFQGREEPELEVISILVFAVMMLSHTFQDLHGVKGPPQ